MVKNRRTGIEIIENILRLSHNGARKTELLYQGNFSYTQLQGYLAFLLENDILEEIVSNNNGRVNRIYINTEKGNNLLEDINKLLTYFE